MESRITRDGEVAQRYLGDGVYASFDGYQIWLRTERSDTIHEIALEPKVMAELADYGQYLARQGA